MTSKRLYRLLVRTAAPLLAPRHRDFLSHLIDTQVLNLHAFNCYDTNTVFRTLLKLNPRKAVQMGFRRPSPNHVDVGGGSDVSAHNLDGSGSIGGGEAGSLAAASEDLDRLFAMLPTILRAVRTCNLLDRFNGYHGNNGFGRGRGGHQGVGSSTDSGDVFSPPLTDGSSSSSSSVANSSNRSVNSSSGVREPSHHSLLDGALLVYRLNEKSRRGQRGGQRRKPEDTNSGGGGRPSISSTSSTSSSSRSGRSGLTFDTDPLEAEISSYLDGLAAMVHTQLGKRGLGMGIGPGLGLGLGGGGQSHRAGCPAPNADPGHNPDHNPCPNPPRLVDILKAYNAAIASYDHSALPTPPTATPPTSTPTTTTRTPIPTTPLSLPAHRSSSGRQTPALDMVFQSLG